jgi:hypothetical protein
MPSSARKASALQGHAIGFLTPKKSDSGLVTQNQPQKIAQTFYGCMEIQEQGNL